MKTESCQGDNLVATGQTVVCHNNKLRCHQWWHSLHHDNSRFQVFAPHYIFFNPTAYFIMMSILLRLILASSIDSAQTVAGVTFKVPTVDEATTVKINSSSADVMPKSTPQWLKWFVRNEDLTMITLYVTVLLARSFALWPQTQVRNFLRSFYLIHRV